MDVHFSRETDEWETPLKIFKQIDQEFSFQLDTCATAENAKCNRFYSKEDSGLDGNWASRNWCNPPYSRIKYWVLKARREQLKGNLTVMLIPARTDAAWFHDSIYNQSDVEIRFVRGRIKFSDVKWNAPFPSMVVIFRPRQ
jgi:phage N-6-adenine-methyltransferase